MEERKAAFEDKDKSIQRRIQKLSSSKERMVEAIKREHNLRLMETQNRFKANVTSYIDSMHEKFTSKTLKADSKISEIRAAMTDE